MFLIDPSYQGWELPSFYKRWESPSSKSTNLKKEESPPINEVSEKTKVWSKEQLWSLGLKLSEEAVNASDERGTKFNAKDHTRNVSAFQEAIDKLKNL